MTELKISDFKMFENAPYELPDAKTFVDANVVGLKAQEKLFGPVFSTLLIKHTLQFVAKRIGEKPPDDIKNLDQLAEYLLSKTDKYPTPYCALMYGQFKTENELQGKTGALTRVGEMSFYRGFGKRVEEKDINLDDIVHNVRKISVEMRLSPKEFGYKHNLEGGVDFLFPNCFFRDMCRQAFSEGLIKRPDGRMHCDLGSTVSQYLKVVTSYEWDFECLEFDKPHCIVRYVVF
nr:hypothetical protein [Candidatus Freyarchaeota archaeon]